jgi:hypothetical protein
MTRQFFERLPESIKDHQLVQAIVKKLPVKFGTGPADVEKLLWCLEELLEYFDSLDDQKHPASWFVPSNSLPKLVGDPHNISNFAVVAGTARSVIRQLRNDIAAKVYEFYSTAPQSDQLSDNWQQLFNLLASEKYWPDIFTTNYDLVIEHAADLAGQPINYGKGQGVIGVLDVDLWKRSLSDAGYVPGREGLLTKLHGSLNWLREHERIIFGGTEYKGDHAYHAVIYPGFKGAPKDEPFSLFHSYLEAAIQRADLIVAVGFAFRDEYITTCFERNLGNKLIHVIDPGEIQLPAAISKNVRHIQLGFGGEAVAELRSAIR